MLGINFVINKSDYSKNMINLIIDDSYSKVKWEHTLKTEMKLSQILINYTDHFIPIKCRKLIKTIVSYHTCTVSPRIATMILHEDLY